MPEHPSVRRAIDARSARPEGDREASDDGVVDGVVERMLAAIRSDVGYDRAALRDCIEAARDCAHAATACADACLAEEMVEELTDGIRILINTADVCDVTARVLARRSVPDRALDRALVAACWATCRRARELCEEFLPIHDHCRVCATACRTAERACLDLLASDDVDDRRSGHHGRTGRGGTARPDGGPSGSA